MRVEIGEQAVFLDQRAVPIPAKTGNDGEIGFEAEGVLAESTDLVRTVVAVGFAADENGRSVFTAEHGRIAEIALEEVGEGVEVEQALISVFVDDVELAVIDLHAADDRVAADGPRVFGCAFEGVLEHAGVGEIVGRTDAEAGTSVRIGRADADAGDVREAEDVEAVVAIGVAVDGVGERFFADEAEALSPDGVWRNR